jgi:hypothetical protein
MGARRSPTQRGNVHDVRRLTKEPWFGPKTRLGWGLSIVSWQGVVVTAVAVTLVVTSIVLLRPLVVGAIVGGVVLAGFIAVAFLTGDPPGGPARSRRR